MPFQNSRWQSLIQVAPSEDETLTLVRRYLGTLTEAELLRLPGDCRPSLPSSREEVASWAVQLVTSEMRFSGDAEAAQLLHQMSIVFSEANTRFAQLAQDARSLPPDLEPET
jgi:hypothetical protein